MLKDTGCGDRVSSTTNRCSGEIKVVNARHKQSGTAELNRYAGAYSLRRRVKFGLGNKIGGLSDLDEEIRLEADFATAHHNHEFVKSNLGDNQGAIIDYQNAALLDQKEGDMKSYRNALKMVEQLKKKGKGFWGGLFS